MTTINRAINKVNKKAQRQAEKRMRKEIIAEHNAAFDQQKIDDVKAKAAFKLQMNDRLGWTSPYQKPAIEAPTLSQMFFLQSDVSTEPQQG